MIVLSDVYDEVTFATGKHQEVTLQGIISFFACISAILQAVIITSVHIFSGYNPDPLAKQSAAAIWGIRIHMALIPIICCRLADFLMIIFYDLKGEKQKILKNKLREKGI